MKICILGSGSWGTALGQVLIDNNHQVIIYGKSEDEINDININHANTRYFENVKLPTQMKATLSLEEALDDADVVVIAVPTVAYRSLLSEVNALLKRKVYLISVAKGFEENTFLRMSEVIRQTIDVNKRSEVVSLIGPSHAEEVILRMLTCISATCINENDAKFVQYLFSNEYFRVYIQLDEIGAEYGAAVKNAIAIASGITQGIGMGDNAKAALVTRGLVEMIRFGVKQGGKYETFMGLTGVGDLMVTCNSHHSRNFQAGYQIGLENNASNFLKNNTKTVEGIKTIKIVYNIAKNQNIDMPIIEGLYQVLYENKSPRDIVYQLMTRELKKE